MRTAIEAAATERGVADKIHVAGYVDDLAAAYRAMDVCALPSILDEGLPTALLEAQLAGVPIVASDIGGTRETIQEGKTGMLVKPNDAESLAAALRQLSSDSARVAAMAAATRPWIQENFRIDHMIAQLRQIYLDALQLRQRGPLAGAASR